MEEVGAAPGKGMASDSMKKIVEEQQQWDLKYLKRRYDVLARETMELLEDYRTAATEGLRLKSEKEFLLDRLAALRRRRARVVPLRRGGKSPGRGGRGGGRRGRTETPRQRQSGAPATPSAAPTRSVERKRRGRGRGRGSTERRKRTQSPDARSTHPLPSDSLGLPPGPPSAFVIFCEEQRQKLQNANKSVPEDFTTLLADLFQELPDSEKQIYQDKHLELTARYKEKRREFETQQLSAGSRAGEGRSSMDASDDPTVPTRKGILSQMILHPAAMPSGPFSAARLLHEDEDIMEKRDSGLMDDDDDDDDEEEEDDDEDFALLNNRYM